MLHQVFQSFSHLLVSAPNFTHNHCAGIYVPSLSLWSLADSLFRITSALPKLRLIAVCPWISVVAPSLSFTSSVFVVVSCHEESLNMASHSFFPNKAAQSQN